MTWSFPEKTDPSRHSVRFGAQEVDERNAKLLQTLSEATDMLAKADEMQVIFGGPEGDGRSSGGTWMIFRRSYPIIDSWIVTVLVFQNHAKQGDESNKTR